MSTPRKNSVRLALYGLLAALALTAAPAAFARSHWSVGVNIGGPGFSVGYADCRHCGWGWGGGYVGAYVPAYYPSYYAPVGYYDTYYPDYYYPSYTSVYYYDGPRHYYRRHDGYRGSYRYGGYGHGGYYGHGHGGYSHDYGRGYGHHGHHSSGYYDRGR